MKCFVNLLLAALIISSTLLVPPASASDSITATEVEDGVIIETSRIKYYLANGGFAKELWVDYDGDGTYDEDIGFWDSTCQHNWAGFGSWYVYKYIKNVKSLIEGSVCDGTYSWEIIEISDDIAVVEFTNEFSRVTAKSKWEIYSNGDAKVTPWTMDPLEDTYALIFSWWISPSKNDVVGMRLSPDVEATSTVTFTFDGTTSQIANAGDRDSIRTEADFSDISYSHPYQFYSDKTHSYTLLIVEPKAAKEEDWEWIGCPQANDAIWGGRLIGRSPSEPLAYAAGLVDWCWYYDCAPEGGGASEPCEAPTTQPVNQDRKFSFYVHWMWEDTTESERYEAAGEIAEMLAESSGESSTLTKPTSTHTGTVVGNVLIEWDTPRTLSTGASLELYEGYELTAAQIDLEGGKVWLVLSRNGMEVDSSVLSVGDTYSYTKDIDDIEYLLVKTKVDAVFRGTDSNIVQLIPTYQYREGTVAVNAVTSSPTSVRTPATTQHVTPTPAPTTTQQTATDTSHQNKSDKPPLLLVGIILLTVLAVLAGKSRRKKQEPHRPTSPTPKPTPPPDPHAVQEAADREEKRRAMERLAKLRDEASSKLDRAKGMLKRAGQLDIDESQLKDLLAKAEEAYQGENYTYAIDCAEKYLVLINKAEEEKKRLEQQRNDASEQIKSANVSIEKAEGFGLAVQHASDINIKAQSAFDANDYGSARRYALQSRDAAEKLIDESKPSISIELPPKMQYNVWKHQDLIVANTGTAPAMDVAITFLTALEVRELEVIKKLDVGERKTINVNIKPTEKGEVPVDYSVKFSDHQEKGHETKDTTTIQITTGAEAAEEMRDHESAELDIKRGYEVLSNNDLRFGVRITNPSSYVILDVQTILDYPRTLFSLKGDVVQTLANIPPNGERTAQYILTPKACIHNEKIDAIIRYKDHIGETHTVHMRGKEVHCVCPFLKENPMREGEFAELVAKSKHIEEGLSFNGINPREIVTFIKESCAHRLHTVGEHEIDDTIVLNLAGESIGEEAYYLLTAVIQPYKEKDIAQIALQAYSDKPYGLHGFLNEITASIRHLVGSVQSAKEIGIIEEKQVINIIDSVVQRTSFGGVGDGGSAEVNVEGSVVHRSDVGGGDRDSREVMGQKREL